MLFWFIRLFLFLLFFCVEVEIKANIFNSKKEVSLINKFPKNCTQSCHYKNTNQKPERLSLTENLSVYMSPFSLIGFDRASKELQLKKGYILIESKGDYKIKTVLAEISFSSGKSILEYNEFQGYDIHLLEGNGVIKYQKLPKLNETIKLKASYSYRVHKVNEKSEVTIDLPQAISLNLVLKQWLYILSDDKESKFSEIKNIISTWSHFNDKDKDYINFQYNRRVAQLEEEERLRLLAIEKEKQMNGYLKWLFRKKNYLLKESFSFLKSNEN